MKIRHAIRTKAFFWVLVPLFFLLKNMDIYSTYIPGPEIVELFVKYIGGACVLYLILSFIFSEKKYKAALCCFLILAIYFFYYGFDQLLQEQEWLYPLNRYRWSLPALCILSGGLLFFIFRLQKKPEKTIYFLNILLIFFCLSELIPITYKLIRPPRPLVSLENDTPLSYSALSSSKHPDIYFLLFDEYQGNAGLEEIFHYDNFKLKNALSEKGFFLPVMARSNYNYTFFSMPSIFNMDYLRSGGEGATRAGKIQRYCAAIKLMQNANLTKFLRDIDYTIVNLSPFAIDRTAKRVTRYETIFAGKELIRRQTFINMLKEKSVPVITIDNLLYFFNPADHNMQYYNQYIREQFLDQLADSSKNSKFVYMHLFMPHFPSFKDSSGRDEKFNQFIDAVNAHDIKYLDEHYLSYLKYTNTVLINTVDTIIKSDPGSIIIIMSDHGYREDTSGDRSFQFNNQFYIRTPEKDYSKWPDTVDAVNVFRLLLNNEFNQKLTYLPYRSTEFRDP